jgi:hypothetical protein
LNQILSNTPQTHLPPDIREALEALRNRIRRYVLLHGGAVFLALLCGLFWLGLTFDVVHFQIRKLELPEWFRIGFLLILIGLLTAAVVSSIFLRILRGYRFKALALVLERQFPQLGDRLITAVELSDDPGNAASGLGGAMLQRTVLDAGERVKSLDLDQVFNRVPLRRWTVIASVLCVSVLMLGVLNSQAMERWFNAYVLLRKDYWEPYRRSSMTVTILAQPGDRVREFDEHGVYKHPRGRDLTLVAEVPQGRQVPEDVNLYYRAEQARGSSRGRVGMSPQSERRFRHTLAEVIDPMDLWVMGGDYVNREPFRIEIVDPPRIERIALQCDYPDYTGMDAFADQERIVQETQVSLPVESSFVLDAFANKQLQGVHVRCADFELTFAPDASAPTPSRLIVYPPADDDSTERGEPRVLSIDPALVGQWFSRDRTSIHVPFSLLTAAQERLAELDESGLESSQFKSLPLPPDTQLQIYLHDTDDIQSDEPTVLTVDGTPDEPPVVDIARQGVRDQITRMAEIPIGGALKDDYGLTDAWFGYRLEDDAESDYTRANLLAAPRGQAEFTLGPAEGDAVERFRVLPLDLRVDQKLELTVFARDTDNLNGPHVAHGEVYTFQIVTPEQLLSNLYDRELNLRQRFEQIRDEITGVREDLLRHRARYEEGIQLRNETDAQGNTPERQEELRQITVAVAACAERNLHLIRKNHTECRSVEVGFGEIRAEMVNNRVDTPTALQRIDYGVLRPLAVVNNSDFPEIDQSLGLFRLANEQNHDPRSAIDRAVVAIDDLLARMESVLAEMEQRKEFNEVVRMLQEILDQQKEVRDHTREEQERKIFELLQ